MPKHSVSDPVTPELQATLDALPPDAPRSRLEPFRMFILRWRRQGRSLRSIQKILADQCGVTVTHETVSRFIKRRSRPRRQEVEPEAEVQVQPKIKPPTASNDRWADARERIRQYKATPAATERKKLFEFSEEDATRPYVFKKEE